MPVSISLAGLYPPIPTPFDSSGAVDEAHLRSNLERWNEQPLDGYVVGGSNGEFAFLSSDERVAVVEAARQEIGDDRLLIAGSASESTRLTIEITKRMAGSGAQAVLVVTPHYFRARMTADALVAHYEQVAEASPVPVVLYSVPANTGIDLPVEAVVRLSDHPNIVGIKDSGGDVVKIGRMVDGTHAAFQVLAGSAGFLLGALAVGAVGAVSALANIAASSLSQLVSSFREGNQAEARELQLRMLEPNRAVTSKFGVAGLKAAMDLLGYYGGPVRSPLQPLKEGELAELRNTLSEAELL